MEFGTSLVHIWCIVKMKKTSPLAGLLPHMWPWLDLLHQGLFIASEARQDKITSTMPEAIFCLLV
jgi:hypothetical protein